MNFAHRLTPACHGPAQPTVKKLHGRLDTDGMPQPPRLLCEHIKPELQRNDQRLCSRLRAQLKNPVQARAQAVSTQCSDTVQDEGGK